MTNCSETISLPSRRRNCWKKKWDFMINRPIKVDREELRWARTRRKGESCSCWLRIRSIWQRKTFSWLRRTGDFRIDWTVWRLSCWVRRTAPKNTCSNYWTWRLIRWPVTSKRYTDKFLSWRRSTTMSCRWQRITWWTFTKSSFGFWRRPLRRKIWSCRSYNAI